VTKNSTVLFNGKVYNQKDLSKHTFPVGCRFKYSNASYNDIFSVISVKKDFGGEFRQISGSVAGEVWMQLATLQKEAADGAVTYIQEPTAKTSKSKKVVKKTKKKAKKRS
jgi:hypothetical protein